jgi:hypothetical protein
MKINIVVQNNKATLPELLNDIANSLQAIAKDYKPGSWDRVTFDSKFARVEITELLEENKGRKLTYLSPAYFDEVVYRIENAEGFVEIGISDPDEWLREFKKYRPAINSISLEHQRSNRYRVSANI